jgi:hypothetical protein
MKNSHKTLGLTSLFHQLPNIDRNFTIDEISIFGGEVSLLPKEYILRLYNLCKEYAETSIITNYSNYEFNIFLKDKNIPHSTTINEERDNNDKVELSLMVNEYNKLSLIQVVTPSLIQKTPKEVLSHLTKFHFNGVGFIQYSPALYAHVNYDITNKEFVEFLKNIIIEYKTGSYDFNISNIHDLDSVIREKYDPTMKSVLFINPWNEYCSVEYKNGLEYFKSYGNNLNSWIDEYKTDYNKYPNECITCNYYRKCYAEHIRHWKSGDECCGMKSLIEWYKSYEKNLY